MKRFHCNPYSSCPGFKDHLQKLTPDNSLNCPNLRILPEDVSIIYPSGPPRKYQVGGMFCLIRAEEVIDAQCTINLSPVREIKKGILAIICSEGRMITFDLDSAISETITKREKDSFLDNRH